MTRVRTYYPMVASRGQRLLSLENFSRDGGVHPDLVRRLVALGLLEPVRDQGGELHFPPSQLAALARIRRLHVGLSLNYAGIGVVLDLLARIDRLETALRTRPRSRSPWT